MEIKTIESDILGSNTHIVIENNEAIIFDAGAELERVIRAVKGLEVKAIFLTHLHFDHIFFLNDYVKEFGCSVYLYDEELIDEKHTLSYMIGDVKIPTGCYRSLKTEAVVSVGEFDVKCIHSPGHSDDSMCYVVDGILFAGDTLFDGTIGRTDLATSSRVDMLDTLERLKMLEFDMCYSGHGQSSTRAEQIENIKYFIMEL